MTIHTAAATENAQSVRSALRRRPTGVRNNSYMSLVHEQLPAPSHPPPTLQEVIALRHHPQRSENIPWTHQLGIRCNLPDEEVFRETVMLPRPIDGDIKHWCCLTSVCLSRTSGLSWEQRPRKTKIGTESHVTRTPLSRSKGQGHQAALLTA